MPQLEGVDARGPMPAGDLIANDGLGHGLEENTAARCGQRSPQPAVKVFLHHLGCEIVYVEEATESAMSDCPSQCDRLFAVQHVLVAHKEVVGAGLPGCYRYAHCLD
jgi:hypothetical protein